jgi:penicillin V acylase-like amidase (Ntn superfamily)
MQKLVLLLAVLLQILNLPLTAIACTSFLMADDKRPLMGKSYDWDLGHGMVVVNQRGIRKQIGHPPGLHNTAASLLISTVGNFLSAG